MYKWLIAIAAAMLACCWPAGTSRAGNPLLALLPFRIIDADPDKSSSPRTVVLNVGRCRKKSSSSRLWSASQPGLPASYATP